MSDCAPSLSRDGAKSHKIRGSTRRGGRIPGANWPQSLGGYEQGIEFCESARSPHALEVRDLCAFCARGVEQGGSSRVLRGLFVDFRGGRQVCVVAEFVAMAAAGLIKNLRVTKTGAGSRSLAESQQRAKDFFREACRALPPIMDRYNLDDVITLSELRTKVASEFRKHHHNTNPKVHNHLPSRHGIANSSRPSQILGKVMASQDCDMTLHPRARSLFGSFEFFLFGVVWVQRSQLRCRCVCVCVCVFECR